MFDEAPFAAASIGQVHRATTLAGDDVVVKIQYPAVKASIDSDMKHLKRILKLGSLLRVDERALDAVFKEIRAQLEEELDYLREADNVRLFQAFHAEDDDVVIPTVFADLSGATVLTLSFEDGVPLENVSDANGFDQALRNRLGERLFDIIGRQIFELRTVHCDPHPGNFAFRTDGSIVLYDFGAVKRLPDGHPGARLTGWGLAGPGPGLAGDRRAAQRQRGVRPSLPGLGATAAQGVRRNPLRLRPGQPASGRGAAGSPHAAGRDAKVPAQFTHLAGTAGGGRPLLDHEKPGRGDRFPSKTGEIADPRGLTVIADSKTPACAGVVGGGVREDQKAERRPTLTPEISSSS